MPAAQNNMNFLTRARHQDRRSQAGPRGAYAWALTTAAATTGIAFLAHQLLPHANLSLLYLTGVLIVSARYGLRPGLLASIVSFILFNFLFTPPFYSLSVQDDGDVATLVFFLVMAAITGNLAARMHREMDARRASFDRTHQLLEFSRLMSSATNTGQIADALAKDLAARLHCPVAVLLKRDGQLDRQAWSGGRFEVSQAEIESIWAREGQDCNAVGERTVLRLASPAGRLGLVILDTGGRGRSQADLDMARSLCDQAAIALDRTLLEATLEEARIERETEQLRSALLSSLSHDLRTPLASVIGSTSSLLDYGGSFAEADRRELLATTLQEARRLDRYIQNLLDMTRLGQGKLSLAREWVDLHDILASAMGRVDRPERVRVVTRIQADVPLLWVHGALIEQALVNLLDNAIRFSPADGEITISAACRNDALTLEVCDEGIGIPDSDKERVFDMFFTARHGDRSQMQGTGLGLAICRGMIGAHGGTISAHDGPGGRGTCMRITLPLRREPATEAI